MEDFLTFDKIDENKFLAKPVANPEQEEEKDTDFNGKLENKMSAKYNRRMYPWLQDRTMRIKDIHLALHSEILDFVDFIGPSREEINIRKLVVKRIARVVNKAYPTAKVLVFGSCATGLNLPNSDIDLLVYHPSMRDIPMINKLTSDLLRANICTSIEPIKHAKVPIIKLQDKETGINIDLSFNR
jgi:non-canonical poly(A) RNA polymerase PAPD5/7